MQLSVSPVCHCKIRDKDLTYPLNYPNTALSVYLNFCYQTTKISKSKVRNSDNKIKDGIFGKAFTSTNSKSSFPELSVEMFNP
jgi:hypothetical protein